MGLPVSSYCSVCASDISATVQTLNLRTVVWVGGGAGCQRSNQEHLAQNLCPRAVRKLRRCAAPLNRSKGACEGKWTSGTFCSVLFRSSQCSRALMNSGKVFSGSLRSRMSICSLRKWSRSEPAVDWGTLRGLRIPVCFIPVSLTSCENPRAVLVPLRSAVILIV